MKGFALDEHGDVLIANGEIQMINGTDLTVQTVKTVLSTNKGEWTFNENEGINFHNILGKKYTEPKTANDEVYVRKIASMQEEIQQARASTEERGELNKLLERRLDGES